MANANKKSQVAVGKTGPIVVGKATLGSVRISAQKARLAVNMIRGMQVEPALQALEFTGKKSTILTKNLLLSAIANAKEQAGADVDKLWVVGGFVNMGRSIKRFMPRARGKANPIIKRSSHVTLQVGWYGKLADMDKGGNI